MPPRTMLEIPAISGKAIDRQQHRKLPVKIEVDSRADRFRRDEFQKKRVKGLAATSSV